MKGKGQSASRSLLPLVIFRVSLYLYPCKENQLSRCTNYPRYTIHRIPPMRLNPVILPSACTISSAA